MRKLFCLLILAAPVYAQFGNATKLRGKAICTSFLPAVGDALAWDDTNQCWGSGAVAAAGTAVLALGGDPNAGATACPADVTNPQRAGVEANGNMWVCSVGDPVWKLVQASYGSGSYALSAVEGTIARGLAAARPAVGVSADGDLYLATDTCALTRFSSATGAWSAALNPSGSIATVFDSSTKTLRTIDSACVESQTALAADKVRTCEVVIGDPVGSALADTNDTPDVCANLTGATMTITEVKCKADTSTGTPEVLPIIHGGAADSILTAAIACGNNVFGSAGTLNGTPVQADGETIDGNISTAGGTAKYIVIRIKRTLP